VPDASEELVGAGAVTGPSAAAESSASAVRDIVVRPRSWVLRRSWATVPLAMYARWKQARHQKQMCRARHRTCQGGLSCQRSGEDVRQECPFVPPANLANLMAADQVMRAAP
jgi:hypothetical protein